MKKLCQISEFKTVPDFFLNAIIPAKKLSAHLLCVKLRSYEETGLNINTSLSDFEKVFKISAKCNEQTLSTSPIKQVLILLSNKAKYLNKTGINE